MLIVPLSGWVHHAATTGFAPIWWPFGQSLPFVPVDATVAATAGAMHWLFTKILAASILLHVAGALKHHLIDRDATLRRMLPGHVLGRCASARPARARTRWPPPCWSMSPLGRARWLWCPCATTPCRNSQTVASDWQVATG
jgi:hypothetical protein